MDQNLVSDSSQVSALDQPSRSKIVKGKVSKIVHRTMFAGLSSLPVNMNKKKKKRMDIISQISVDVSSYEEFHSLLDQYVTQGGAPVSFNISEDVDSPSYDKILKELIASIIKSGGRDKIQHPRYHTPMPIVPCSTPEVMKNLYNAIGSFWTVIIGTEWGLPEGTRRKLLTEMHRFQSEAGIRSSCY